MEGEKAKDRYILVLKDGTEVPVGDDVPVTYDNPVAQNQAEDVDIIVPADAVGDNTVHPVYVVEKLVEKKRYPHDYLACSIISILCFLPLGIPALYCSTKIQDASLAGNYQAAKRAVFWVRLLVFLAFCCMLVWVALVIVGVNNMNEANPVNATEPEPQ
ncbi:uncharacterized protein LOC100369394 [Saccoglossus kowalevskii]|uniref:Uncharacterized protein LOC100369394 n=1 Tax=Saccoglossus kowalevskii TaxID=10224 RepID=A0ABM0GZ09_SACKO|nr:PREDICTED: uncharacterized protein LOC100369394 [Saccoglossus kowalevskii]